MKKQKIIIRNLLVALALGACTATAIAKDINSDYRNNTLYFIVTDRFNVYGNPYVDPKYPDATNSVDCFNNLCPDESQWRKYWGGNIQGVIHKLDYLRSLGISGIWLTPLMENIPSYEKAGWGTGYHGYWVQNPYRVSPHFGNWNDVDQLSSSLHSYGMSYMQDITLNHSNPSDSHMHGVLYDESGNVLIENYQADNKQMYKHYEGDPQCVDAQQKPDADWSYWQLHHCLLAKLSGYNQENPAMASYLNNAYKLWLSHGVDSLRLDAVKFVFPDFLTQFNQSMTKYAVSLGHPAPYIIGEWSDGGIGDAKSLDYANSYERNLSNILDFKLSFALNRFIGGDYEPLDQQTSASQLGQLLNQRESAFNGRGTWQGNFLDNHDEIRTMVRLQKLNVTSEMERQKRMDLGTVLLMTVPGIPIIYYGDEQYLAHYDDHQSIPPKYINSGNDDPYNRGGMTKWSQDTSAFKIIKTLAKLRKDSPAIARGDYRTLYADKDVLVFLRTYKNDSVLIAVNRGDSKEITFDKPLNVTTGKDSNLLQSISKNYNGDKVKNSGKYTTLFLNSMSAMVIHF